MVVITEIDCESNVYCGGGDLSIISVISDDHKKGDYQVIKYVGEEGDSENRATIDLLEWLKINGFSLKSVNNEHVFVKINDPIINENTVMNPESVNSHVDEHTQTKVKKDHVKDYPTVIFPDTFVTPEIDIEFGSLGPFKKFQNGDIMIEPKRGASNNNLKEILNDLQENGNMFGNQTIEESEMNFPRFEDEELVEQIEKAQMLYDEKRRCRDVISRESQINWEIMRTHNDAYFTAIMKIKDARQLVKSKHQEIKYIQRVLKKLIKVILVEGIDSKVYKMDHTKDEKQLIPEIKQLKRKHDQISSNQYEIQLALHQNDQIEQLLKDLKSELETLKEDVRKAGVVAKEIKNNYMVEFKTEKKLRAQFIATNEICKEAYENLNNLKKRLNDKNKETRNFASCEDEDSFYDFWADQVEIIMEESDTNESMVTSTRPNTIQKVVSNSVIIPDEIKSVSSLENKSETETQKTVLSVEEKHSDDQTETVAVEHNKIMETEEPTDMIENKEIGKTDEKITEIIENKETEKSDELMKEEIEAKLEENMKAKKAMRKKRKAEEARMRAEKRAQKEAEERAHKELKEAEEKEKARLKRLNKKRKKRTGGGNIKGGDMAGSKEIENPNEEQHECSPPPPPQAPAAAMTMRNEGRWRPMVVAATLIPAMFVLHIISFF